MDNLNRSDSMERITTPQLAEAFINEQIEEQASEVGLLPERKVFISVPVKSRIPPVAVKRPVIPDVGLHSAATAGFRLVLTEHFCSKRIGVILEFR